MRARLAVAAVALAPTVASAESLTVSLSHHRVQITSTYTGAELVVFGLIGRDAAGAARAGGYDIVITARGPRAATVVREKQPLGPIWINRAQVKFFDLPVTKAVLATKPLEDIAEPELRRRYRIGLDTATIPKVDASAATGREIEFRAALLRLKTSSGLYTQNERGVVFIADNVFRGNVPVPATAPLGNYEVEVALFQGGVRLAQETTNFEVTKAGFEQLVARESREQSWLYGALTAAVALMFGWIATVIFRRD